MPATSRLAGRLPFDLATGGPSAAWRALWPWALRFVVGPEEGDSSACSVPWLLLVLGAVS